MINIVVKESNQNTIDRYSLFISFPYNEKIVDVIRECPIRYWNKDNKEWELPIKKLSYLVENLSDFDFDISGDSYQVLNNTSMELPTEFEYKTKPYSHQIDGINYGLSHDRWLLGDEMGLGKALALDTKIYTPTGYKLMKDIKVGDYVLGRDGKPTKVLATYNHKNVEMYRITFSDEVSIECCKDHLWKIHDQHGSKVVDTKWFTEKDQFGKVRSENLKAMNYYKYWIDRCEPVQFEYQEVPINAYVLGALLGDGGLTSNSIFFATADGEMVDNINDRLPKGYELCSTQSMSNIDYIIKGTKGKTNLIKKGLVELGLWKTNSHTKFIPDIYKYNSISIRIELLQGLLDTDGYASKDNLLTFTSVSKQLCDDVRFLVESLGGIANYHIGVCKYNNKVTGTSHNLTIRFDNPQLYVTLTRKKSILKERTFKPHRSIVSVEQINNADAKCITVDNDEHLYLAEHFIVTHNTKQVIDLAVIKKLQKGYKHCLIICGVNGLKWNWRNEVHTHSNESAWILGMRRNSKGKTVIGSSEDKLHDIEHLPDDYFIITNVESLRYKVWTGEYKTVKGKKTKVYDYPITDALVKSIEQGEISMIAFDEAHKCKNSESDQGSQLLRLDTECKIAMTGTPLMNNPLDLYTIFNWLGYEKHSLYSFKKHYCNFGGYGGYEVVGYKNMDEIREKLDSIMLRRKKEEVLDLPEKTYIDEYVEMTPKQKQIYDEATAEITMNIDQIKMASNPLTELIRMRQATGYTGILSSKIQESAKLDRMEEIVDEAIINGKQVVIFSNWTQMTTPIFQRLLNKGISVGCITGQTKDADRQIISDDFQNGGYQVLLGTTSAMGTGLTLTAGTVEIFMDEPWNKANKVQAEDRCHRIGQTNNLTIYTIMCAGTIDEKIHDLVEEKGAMADAIVDGGIKMDRGMVIDYLLS